MSDLQIVGKSYPQIDGMDKAMGRTRFLSDMILPNMLYGRILRSPHSHARIKNVDISRAAALSATISREQSMSPLR